MHIKIIKFLYGSRVRLTISLAVSWALFMTILLDGRFTLRIIITNLMAGLVVGALSTPSLWKQLGYAFEKINSNEHEALRAHGKLFKQEQAPTRSADHKAYADYLTAIEESSRRARGGLKNYVSLVFLVLMAAMCAAVMGMELLTICMAALIPYCVCGMYRAGENLKRVSRIRAKLQ